MRRQIMILTGDQKDDFPETKVVKPSYCSVTKVVKPSYSSASKPRSLSITSSHGSMSLWQYEYNSTNSEAVPVQHAESWGISTGTGVFIPLSTVKPIRNNKPKSRGRVNDRRIKKRADNKH
ncbi:uncharacterized protein LOC126792538 [Argentina anserina]|uniref:uncharacterized protein LOC126792538 n=1 Tax=Argentina anserina TaxID=57926 RepID=UPI0021764C3B|nr:uncharacterized protein LOC126792538 [Potentilla anserina]